MKRLRVNVAQMRVLQVGALLVLLTAGCERGEQGEPWLSTHPDGSVRERGFVILPNEGPPVRVGEWRVWDTQGELVSRGQYVLGKKSGRWIELGAEGLLEEGLYDAGQRTGVWVFRDRLGRSRREGAYVAGNQSGTWTFTDEAGRSDVVRFAADGSKIVQSAGGLRTALAADGSKQYEGPMRDGKRDGEWVFWGSDGAVEERRVYSLGRELSIETRQQRTTFWPNGEIRDSGPLENGKRVGRWVSRNESGESLGDQVFEEDVLVASELDGILTRYDAQGLMVARGPVQHGKEQGLWEEYFSSGVKRAEGVYRFMRKEDVWTYWHENGQMSERGRYERNERVGGWSAWHANGREQWRGQYVGGKREGAWESWHENGQLQSQGEYRAGRREGDWTEWYPSGNRLSAGRYAQDLKEGVWLFWRDQVSISVSEYDGVEKRGRFAEGKEVGTWTYWQPNGHKDREGEFRNGLMEGKWYLYGTTGRLARIATFVKGEEVK